MGEKEQAKEYFAQAASASARELEMRFYRGLALQMTGKDAEAQKTFDDLIAQGQGMLKSEESVDFFAKFGERQSGRERISIAHYLIGLGYNGKDDTDKAKTEFQEALKANQSHLWAKAMLTGLDAKNR